VPTKIPVLTKPEDYPDRILGEASTKAQALKLIVKASGCDSEQIKVEKVGTDNLFNTIETAYWTFSIVQIATELTPKEAIAILKLPDEFDLFDLKTAYRTASKKAHPDAGGTEAKFIQVNRAYDLLMSLVLKQDGSSERWNLHVAENLGKWEKVFRKSWKAMVDRGLCNPEHQYNNANRYGLWYSTTIENFARNYTEPLPSWFLNCVYPPLIGGGMSMAEVRQRYREHLIQIAPNKTLSEVWARKYWCLEFGESVPWVFYLMPAKEG